MKRILLVVLLTIPIFSKAQDCANPLTNATFQTGFNLIASQVTNQKKLDQALVLINKSCLLSTQIKHIAVLFTEDNYRFEFCRAAYLSAFDRVNYFEVYDAFTSFSYALRLYDFTRNPQQITVPILDTPVEKIKEPTTKEAMKELIVPKFGDFIYPSPNDYTGNKGCEGPIANDASFNTRAIQIASQPTDDAKLIAIRVSTEEACYSMAQLMKLTSLIGAEKIRYNALSECFPKIYDQDHYISGRSLFKSNDLQNQWVTSAEFMLTPAAPGVCVVEAAAMKEIQKSLQSKSFSSEKLDLLGSIKNDKCFTVEQISMISKEFAFDKDKVTVMKMLYAGCPNKEDYSKLLDELSFGYLQDELTQFIKNEGRN